MVQRCIRDEVKIAEYLSSALPSTPCHPPSMDLTKMTTAEVEALLKLLAEWEREELELVLKERREAERERRLH